MKFITTIDDDGVEEVFTFPDRVHHDAMAEVLEGIKNQTHRNWERVFRRPVAAGFVRPDGTCYGRSETLDLAAWEADTTLLTIQKNVYHG